jgi:short-subunit dehydrogenase
MARSLSPRNQERIRHRYGPWAVVTGASSGIGREFALQCAAAGLNVVLIARRAEELRTLAAEIHERYGTDCRALPADLADGNQAAATLTNTTDLDVGLLVAAAGFGTSGPLLGGDLANEQAMLSVNCSAVLTMAQHFGNRFTDRGRGGIVLLSSIVAYQGVPRAAHYAATKAYVQTLAEGLHEELRPAGVDVLAVAPGPVHTGFADTAGMTMGRALKPVDVAVPALAALGRRAVSTPGPQSKLLTWSLSTLPRRMRVVVMGRVMGAMTPATAITGRT